jgi:hypothetical protein
MNARPSIALSLLLSCLACSSCLGLAEGRGEGASPVDASRDYSAYNVKVVVDCGKAETLEGWSETVLVPMIQTWYPKLLVILQGRRLSPYPTISVRFDPAYQGVAYDDRALIVANPKWILDNLSGESLGALFHELVHAVQQYGFFASGEGNPGWLVEGIADYYRWFVFEPYPAGCVPVDKAKASYEDSYMITAGFLAYLVDRVDPQVVAKLNSVLREGRYSKGVWKKLTGKDLDADWADYVASLKQ